MFFRRAKEPAPDTIDGVRVRPSARARRMSLKVEARSGDVVLVWPQCGVSVAHAKRFILEHRNWIEKQQDLKTDRRPFQAGSAVLIAGRSYKIVHVPGRGLTHIAGDSIVVHGEAAHLPRRLKDFLKGVAQKVLAARVSEKNARLGLKSTQIRVIDPKTRWGSCGPDGRLMFSWRLIMAPPDVLDYVVAHEVAHRVHMNHSRKFWALCLSLSENGAAARRWLKKNGAGLMAV